MQTILSDSDLVRFSLQTCKKWVSVDRIDFVSMILQRWLSLIWTEYVLWWSLWKWGRNGIDCSHFVAYCLWLSNWEMENTRKLDTKYKDNQISLKDAEVGDLLMRPWHYDPSIWREIWHVELFIGYQDYRIVTLWATWKDRKIVKYWPEWEVLDHYNCVWFSIRTIEQEEGIFGKWMRLLRAEKI